MEGDADRRQAGGPSGDRAVTNKYTDIHRGSTKFYRGITTIINL